MKETFRLIEMIRFQIIVFNFERISSFLDNFDKITNFRPTVDQLVVMDCSRNWRGEKQLVVDFAKQNRLTLGQDLLFIRRRNWGIDQGARIEYFQSLQKEANRPKFIWQFQEHYLDLNSPWSIWNNEQTSEPPRRKEDTIPDGVGIDLDFCERVYEDNPDVFVIYADRAKIGVFTNSLGNRSFYADGANFSTRASYALSSFREDLLASYKNIYDGTYTWTLFIELDIGSRMTQQGANWFDLVTGSRFDSFSTLREIEDHHGVSLHQEAEEFYAPLYSAYDDKLRRALALSPTSRKLRSTATHCYLRFANNSIARKTLGPALSKLKLVSLARKTLFKNGSRET